MTSRVYARSLVPRRRLSQLRHTSAVARHTCSIVTSGFFFPQPLGVLGDEPQSKQAQGHVPHQRHITSALEVREAEFALGGAKTVFDVPAAEGNTHEQLHGSVRRGIGEEELLLARLVVARPDQTGEEKFFLANA